MPRTSDISIGVRMCANVSTMEPCPMVATRTRAKMIHVRHRRTAAQSASRKAGCPIMNSFVRGRA